MTTPETPSPSPSLEQLARETEEAMIHQGAIITECSRGIILAALRQAKQQPDPGAGREIWQAMEGETPAPDAEVQAGTPETDVIVGAMVQPVQWPIVDKLESLERERNEARAQLTAAQARISELETSLLAIGEMAVADWSDEVVGKVDAVVKERLRYRSRLAALFDIERERETLRAELAAVKQERDELLRRYNIDIDNMIEAHERLGARPEQSVRERTDEIVRERDALAAKLKVAEADTKRLQEDVCTLRAELNAVRKERDGALRSIEREGDSGIGWV